MEPRAPRNLVLPPSSVTDNSAAAVWESPPGGAARCYQVFVNGSMHGVCAGTFYTAERLESDASYELSVRAVMPGGDASAQCAPVLFRTKPRAAAVSAADFGAAGDGCALDTRALQTAIDACPAGGRVIIPPGRYLTGALFLKSDMTLFVEKGATLLGSVDIEHYPLMTYRWEGRETLCHASLINTPPGSARLKNIAIEGGGTIDASGAELKKNIFAAGRGARGRAVCIRNTDGVYLKDITVRQSPSWCVHLIYCRGVSVNGVSINTKHDEFGRVYKDIFNGDGLDPDSCSNVHIFGCEINSQDDCIAIKSGRDGEGRSVGIPSEHIKVIGCSFKNGFGVAVGSEMSGGVRDVLVRDCVFENSHSVATIKAPRARGGLVEDVLIENCILTNRAAEHGDTKWFRGAINVDLFYSVEDYDPGAALPFDEGTPVFRGIVFKNIVIDTHAGNAVFLAGLPESPLEGITLEDVTAIGKYGFKAYNVRGLALKNVLVTSREDEDMAAVNVTER